MSIVLNSVTFNWVGFDRSQASRWTATASGVASSFANLTARVTIGSMTGTTKTPSRIKFRLVQPVVATEDSSCACVGTVLRTAYIDISADFDPTATATERNAALASIKDLVLTTQFGDAFTSLAQPAG